MSRKWRYSLKTIQRAHETNAFRGTSESPLAKSSNKTLGGKLRGPVFQRPRFRAHFGAQDLPWIRIAFCDKSTLSEHDGSHAPYSIVRLRVCSVGCSILNHAKSNALDEYVLKMGLDIKTEALDVEYEPKPQIIHGTCFFSTLSNGIV